MKDKSCSFSGNSKHITFKVNFLLDRYHGKEWPPSPRRFFLALIAALYQSPTHKFNRKEMEKALMFLEAQEPPDIYVADHVQGQKYRIFVPDNNMDQISKNYNTGKESSTKPEALKSAKFLVPHIVESPLLYVWKFKDEKNANMLCKLAREITVLGLGIDPVTVDGNITDQEPEVSVHIHYMPKHDGDEIIQVPIPGLLDDARSHHNEFINRLQNDIFVQPSPITKYTQQKYRKEMTARQIIAFKLYDTSTSTGPSKIITDGIMPAAIEVLDKVKQKILLDIQLHDPNYVKTIVLPTVGEHGDSLVRRIGFLMPEHTSMEIKAKIYRLNNSIIKIASHKYILRVLKSDDPMLSTYGRSAKTWCSVTPIDFGLDKNLTGDNMKDLLLQELNRNGLNSRHISFVRFRKVPYWSNLPKVTGSLAYAEIGFEIDVRGSFALGANQECGYGLFVPASLPQVAYFTILGTRPGIEKTALVAHLTRRAVMSKIKQLSGSNSIPQYISGHDAAGNPLRDNHRHAFWLPLDNDQDGLIDHIVVFAKDGFDSLVRNGFYNITHLNNGNELRLNVFFKGFYNQNDISKKFTLFGKHKIWSAITPYFMPLHVKKTLQRDEQITNEIKQRWSNPDNIPKIVEYPIRVNGREIPITRFQSMFGNKKPINRKGNAVKLSFDDAVSGPLALGYGAHFGLGLFYPCYS